MTKKLVWLAIAIVYLLTLLTQLPHVFYVYSALERIEHQILGISTAWQAAIAFEASVAILTLRTIVNRKSERSRYTRPGIIGFLLMSALANLSYYFDIELVDSWLMPGALVFAIPAALWLYAEEFGADAKAAIRTQEREKKKSEEAKAENPFSCWCGESFVKQQQLAAHKKKHINEMREAESPEAAQELLREKYPQLFNNGDDPLTEKEIKRIRAR
jgi:hypothetical protein